MSGDFTVHLDRVFEGPLDLLLHLVREQEVEIVDVRIATVVDGYLAYLEKLADLDIEVAGEFLVMAATLMAIKSRSLLPGEEVDLEEELDPGDELIQRLLEFRRFKGVADELATRLRERARIAPRGFRGEVRELEGEREIDLGDLTAWDLLASWSRLLRETRADGPARFAIDPRPLRYYVEAVVDALRSSSDASLSSLVDGFDGVPLREALIGSFCALLELVRLELVTVDQDDPHGEISVSIRPEHAADIVEIVRAAGLEEEPESEPEATNGTADGPAAANPS